MGLKKLRFEIVDHVRSEDSLGFGVASGRCIYNFWDDEIVQIIRNGAPRDVDVARKELLHRRSPYRGGNPTDQMSTAMLTCQYSPEPSNPDGCFICQYNSDEGCMVNGRNRTEILLSMAEDYLNGKKISIVDCRSKPTERKIQISALLNELEYRGFKVLNIEVEEEDVLEEENVGERIVSESKDVLDYVLSRTIPEITHVRGTFVYKSLGIEYPFRGGTLNITWYGRHQDGEMFTDTAKTSSDDGSFAFDSPCGLIISSLVVRIEYGKIKESFTFKVSELRETDGDLGKIVLNHDYSHMEGLVETLDNMTFDLKAVRANEDVNDIPEITIGEGDDMFALSPGTVPSNYTYGVLHKLISPNMIGDLHEITSSEITLLKNNPYSTRKSLNSPIDTDLYKTTLNKTPAKIAKMGTLGIGYVLSLQQEWKPLNFSLGTLLYSVALAPGEEQKVVVSERSESYEVKDVESLSSDLSEEYQSDQQSDTDAVFARSVNEYTHGSTWMKSTTSGGSTGLLAAIFCTASSSKTTTDSTSSNYGSRNEASSLSESFDESISREAQRSRESSRVGIRMATSEESSSVTSKIIANRNHSHALTMQYWEVVRNYVMNTRVSDVRMVCYVPFELIQFLPDKQDHIISAKKLTTHAENAVTQTVKEFFYERYSTVLRYYDAVNSVIPYKYSSGLALMKKYASYPDWDFQKSNENQPVTLNMEVTGNFMSYQNITAVLHLKNRKGAISGVLTTADWVETHKAKNKYDLINSLEKTRRIAKKVLKFRFDVPPGIKDDDFNYVSLNISYPSVATYEKYMTEEERKALNENVERLASLWGLSLNFSNLQLYRRDLMNIGGPIITDLKLEDESGNELIKISKADGTRLNRSKFRGEELHSSLTYPIYDDKPTMSFEELQKIETTFQHVVENIVRYSQAVWSSLTPVERAMLFERYTVALPGAMSTDVGGDIPLADCIENKIEGFYGNCMVVPFSLPSELAFEMGTSTKDIQDALYAYHADTFRSSQKKISLPVGGLLGEAVLGGSNASEKIDITRFWNWQDSPIDDAPEIDLSKIPDISLLSGAAAPESLLALKQALTIGNKGATAMPDIAEELTKESAEFANITNAQAVSDHMTAIAKKASEERMNTVSKGAIVAKAVMKAAAAAAGGAAAGGVGGAAGGVTEAAGSSSNITSFVKDFVNPGSGSSELFTFDPSKYEIPGVWSSGDQWLNTLLSKKNEENDDSTDETEEGGE